MKLNTKMYLGFGALVLLLAIGAANSFWAINALVTSGQDAIDTGNKAVFLTAKEGDHFKWVNQVMSLFMNNEKTLNVTLDPTKCSLGQYLNSPQTKALAALDPKLASLLKDIKTPHEKLHQSAAKIKEA